MKDLSEHICLYLSPRIPSNHPVQFLLGPLPLRSPSPCPRHHSIYQSTLVPSDIRYVLVVRIVASQPGKFERGQISTDSEASCRVRRSFLQSGQRQEGFSECSDPTTPDNWIFWKEKKQCEGILSSVAIGIKWNLKREFKGHNVTELKSLRGIKKKTKPHTLSLNKYQTI